MVFRFGVVCILGVFLVSCEESRVSHRTGDFDLSNKNSPVLTSLQPKASLEIDAISDRMIVAEAPANEQRSGFSVVDPFPIVYFSFDSWEVNNDVRSRLHATADWMTRFPQYGLTIEGHADARGTESYNMVLGARRAQAVKEYLKNLGIPPKRVDIVSYGKVLNVCEIDDELKCHQFNRRAELLLE
ncbi:MAG: OmpA family protein [Nitrospirales bacterium]|nr:OmpA family protein [Nitrospiraceae bacterium]MDR4486821.1 OmpA family protein [Nitrospirales bacterium]